MYYTLYIDVFFLENLLLDYLLLSLLGKLLKCPAKWLSRLAGALLGSAGLCLMLVLGIERTLGGRLFFYLGLSTGMVALGTGLRRPALLARGVILLYVQSFLLGGLFQWVQRVFHFPVAPFLFFTLTAYLLLHALLRWLLRFREQERSICEVTLGYQGRTVELRALLDTGNRLRDPLSGEAVSILAAARKQELCGEEEPVFRLVPFQSLGRRHGLLPVFRADFLEIRQEDGEVLRKERPLLGVADGPLSSGKDYDLILHPALLEQGGSAKEDYKSQAAGRARGRRPCKNHGGRKKECW